MSTCESVLMFGKQSKQITIYHYFKYTARDYIVICIDYKCLYVYAK